MGSPDEVHRSSAPVPRPTTYTTLGKIDGITANQATVQGTGGGAGVTFPVTRGLYNVYNNSTALVPSSQATLNFTSEYGFLCKASDHRISIPPRA